jgi:hypothetical protein
MSGKPQFTRNQHTVPQWHLREFTNINGELFCYKQNKPVKKSRPKGECFEPNFYEFEFIGKKSDNKFEDLLGRIENDAAPRLRTLLSGNPLDRQGSKEWALYVASLFVRSPKYRAQISDQMIQKLRTQTEEPDYISRSQRELLDEGKIVALEVIQRKTEQFVRSLESSPAFYHMFGLERHTVSIASRLLNKTWRIVQAPPEKFFLMSDCPVSTAEVFGGAVNPGVGFAKEHALVFMPVTPQHVFIASPRSSGGAAVAQPEFVDSLNRLTVQFAHKRVFAHVDVSWIKALVDREVNLIVFGKNAFLAA